MTLKGILKLSSIDHMIVFLIQHYPLGLHIKINQILVGINIIFPKIFLLHTEQ